MYEIIIEEGTGLEANGINDLMQLAESLAPYAAKDFAVRYGHLGDGYGKTQ